MNKMMKMTMVVVTGLLVANCSSTYKMKTEQGKLLDHVPKLYVADCS